MVHSTINTKYRPFGGCVGPEQDKLWTNTNTRHCRRKEKRKFIWLPIVPVNPFFSAVIVVNFTSCQPVHKGWNPPMTQLFRLTFFAAMDKFERNPSRLSMISLLNLSYLYRLQYRRAGGGVYVDRPTIPRYQIVAKLPVTVVTCFCHVYHQTTTQRTQRLHNCTTTD
jgi:hypothetical protein